MSSKERTLSVVVAVVDETPRLFEKLGGAEALHAIDRCMKRMLRGIDGFHGQVVRSRRDDLTAIFANANDACQATIAMQRRIADLPPVSGMQLAIRVGFQHGTVFEQGGDFLGDCVNTAECLAELAVAGQVLTSGEARALLSPHLQSSTRHLQHLDTHELPTKTQVFEVPWLEPRAAAAPVVIPPRPAPERDLRLCVRYGGDVKLLDRQRPTLVMGRDAACDINVRDRRASRHHARIERRGEHFVLRDLSTNGTFITVSGERELFLRHEEFVLRGSGIISFASSANHPNADIAEFEHL